MNDLIDTTEMYLRTIYDLEEEGVVPLRARIAERLEQIEHAAFEHLASVVRALERWTLGRTPAGHVPDAA